MLVTASMLATGCESRPDPRTTRGALAFASIAIEEGDGERLFRVIDERSRHALYSIVEDRGAARALIEAHYPEAERAGASSALGDAAHAESPAALFAQRCDAGCRQEIASALGAPTSEESVDVHEGQMMRVETTRGELELYRPREGAWWGIVWRTQELDDERDRASRDRRRIEQNAEMYQTRARMQE